MRSRSCLNKGYRNYRDFVAEHGSPRDFLPEDELITPDMVNDAQRKYEEKLGPELTKQGTELSDAYTAANKKLRDMIGALHDRANQAGPDYRKGEDNTDTIRAEDAARFTAEK